MNNQKCNVFWQDPKTELYTLNGKEGKTFTPEQKEKLALLLEPDHQLITVLFKKIPLNNK